MTELLRPFDARILVVDDNRDSRYMLTRRLQRAGYSCIEEAANGEEALAMNATQAFDVVLLDVMMPRVGGVEVLERLRAEGRLEDTPVIMISASTEVDTVVRCLELGAEDYLPKPFNSVLLRARLGSVLEKRTLRAEVRRQLARMEAELAEARKLQLTMLPTEFPSPAAADGSRIDVHAIMQPAHEVGGDLYDCFEVGEHTLCIALGDVSDKGMHAALFMARTRSLLRAASLQHFRMTGTMPAPSEIVAVLNDELCKNNPSGMFVTLFFGFLDIDSGGFRYVNAGHPRPLWLRGGGELAELDARPGPPLGVVETARHDDAEAILSRGDMLVVVSDGLTDMLDPEGNAYTRNRLRADLASLGQADAAMVTARLLENVLTFADGAPQADDVTVLALRIWPAPALP
jgi:phosphoserine phosphatase RsbU/P